MLEPQGLSGLPVKHPRRYKGRFYRNFTAFTMGGKRNKRYPMGLHGIPPVLFRIKNMTIGVRFCTTKRIRIPIYEKVILWIKQRIED